MRLLKELPEVKFGPDAVTWQALIQSLAASTEEVLMPDGNYHPMSCITIVSSEFGTLLNPSDREMVDVMVSLWDGQIGTWEKATKTQGSDLIVNPWINLIACTTPSWIAGNFPDYMIGGGFTSRCVFVFGNQKRRLIAYPGNELPTDFKERAGHLVSDLERISQLAGQYTMSPDAVKWGEEWYATHYASREDSKLDEATFGGYFARKQTHIHKLAMVLAASKRDELIIEKEDLVEAERQITILEEDMPQVFKLIGRTQDARSTDVVFSFLSREKVVDKEVLVRELMSTLSLQEIENGLHAVIASGLAAMKSVGGRVLVYLKSPVPATPPAT
jgi:hypothetical protein